MKWIVVIFFLMLGAAGGCSGDSPRALFETAQLEEKQNSLDHARQLYREIIEKYPDSEVAAAAGARLHALGDTP